MKWFMNQQPPLRNNVPDHRRNLEQRLTRRPDLLERLHAIADLLDQSLAEGCSADQTEARVIEQVRLLGQEILGQWAQETHAVAQQQMPRRHPQAVREGKKKLLTWQTTFGPITVQEILWRLGRRGPRCRPFCERAAVVPRGCSQRLQRVLVDFGAEESLAMSTRQPAAPKRAADCVVTEMDGSMIPVVVASPEASDARKGKQLLWREARLCLARGQEEVRARYGATLGRVEWAGQVWAQTGRAAGVGPQTVVHGVGDGASWIVQQFGEQFGPAGRYLVDFYHVSEYLAAAAGKIAPAAPERWRRRQQGRLLNNEVGGVLRALAGHLEREGAAEAPVRTAHRYLTERRGQLDYAGARARGLPIGSGEIESGHRHVVQQRLKLAGAWWKEPNAEAMLGLRVGRANGLWESYWQEPVHAQN
jgi:hypothetical protein